jgi:hypothetical protein
MLDLKEVGKGSVFQVRLFPEICTQNRSNSRELTSYGLRSRLPRSSRRWRSAQPVKVSHSATLTATSISGPRKRTPSSAGLKVRSNYPIRLKHLSG